MNNKFRLFLIKYSSKLEILKKIIIFHLMKQIDISGLYIMMKKFCFPYVLFSINKNLYFSSISLRLNNWKKLNLKVLIYENSPLHKECVFKWKLLLKRLSGNKTIDCAIQNAIKTKQKSGKLF